MSILCALGFAACMSSQDAIFDKDSAFSLIYECGENNRVLLQKLKRVAYGIKENDEDSPYYDLPKYSFNKSFDLSLSFKIGRIRDSGLKVTLPKNVNRYNKMRALKKSCGIFRRDFYNRTTSW